MTTRNWSIPSYTEWVADQDNWFEPHSSRVFLPTDRADIQKVVPDYDKPSNRPPFDVSG